MSSRQGRRRSVSRLELRRLRKQLNARLKESVINKLATLKKLYNCPKEASVKFQQLLQQKYLKSVVLGQLVVVLLLQALLQLYALTQHAAAAPPLYINSALQDTFAYINILIY
jgi:hypothetical protein